MASRINYTVSVTGINTIPAQENDYREHDIVDAQLGGSIAAQVTIPAYGAMVQVTSIAGSTYGPNARYSPATPLGGSFAEFSQAGTLAQLLYVKHTGRLYNTPSALGAVTEVGVTVKVNLVTIATLAPGQALVLPLPVGPSFPVVQVQAGGSEFVAVEAIILG